MPSNYAHYRFGAAVLNKMPADLQRTVKRFRRLYDVGLHGPDLFFYYNPLQKNRFGDLGSRMHRQTGQQFFSRVCRGLRLDPTEEAQAYLYGVLSHYSLDARCHPFVNRQVEQGIAGHIELETEFDRFLLEQDGKLPPHTQDLSGHMQLTPRERQVVARFYPGTTERAVSIGLKNMALATRAFATKSSVARKTLLAGLGLAGKPYQAFMMTQAPNPSCCHLNEPLLACYRQAETDFSDQLLQLSAHLTYNAPLGELFAPIFG